MKLVLNDKNDKIMNNIFKIFCLACLILTTQSCARAVIRKSLGLKQDAPDEFMIEPKKKLEVPENIPTDLPPPQNEKKAKLKPYNPEATLSEVFNSDTKVFSDTKSSVEEALLNRAEADKIKADVRKTVENDYENRSSIFGTTPGSTMESILDPFGYNRDTPEIIDGKKENARIRRSIAEGRSIVSGKPFLKKEE